MNNHNLIFDFTVSKANKMISVNREFAARLPLVWDAFTKQEILDQWGAPAPYKAQTLSMEFKIGGRRFYKMISPEGQEHYAVQDYTSISQKTNIQYISGFSDKDQNINPEFYGSENNLDFIENNGLTTVRISIRYKTLAILEMMIEKGFKQGFTMTLDNLDKVLAS